MFVYLFVKMCTINLFFFSPAIKLWKTMSFGEERRLSAINGQQGENILLCLRRITIPYLLKKELEKVQNSNILETKKRDKYIWAQSNHPPSTKYITSIHFYLRQYIDLEFALGYLSIFIQIYSFPQPSLLLIIITTMIINTFLASANKDTV